MPPKESAWPQSRCWQESSDIWWNLTEGPRTDRRKPMKTHLVKAVLTTLDRLGRSAYNSDPPPVKQIVRDLRYGPDHQQTLDIIIPPAEPPLSCVTRLPHPSITYIRNCHRSSSAVGPTIHSTSNLPLWLPRCKRPGFATKLSSSTIRTIQTPDMDSSICTA